MTKKFLYSIWKEKNFENYNFKCYYINSKKNIEKIEENFNYYIFVNKKEFQKLKINKDELKGLEISKKIYYDFKENEVLKLICKNQDLYDSLIYIFKTYNVKTYEKDLSYKKKFIIDKDIKFLIDDKNKNESLPILKLISLDIETINLENPRIILISLIDYDYKLKKVLVNKNEIKNDKLKELETKKINFNFDIELLDNEKKLLLKFKEIILNFSPQLIVGWNVIDFDFKVIKERFQNYDIPFTFAKETTTECKTKFYEDFLKESTIICEKVLIMDVLQIMKSNSIYFSNFKLDNVSKLVLDDKKINLLDEENLDELDSGNMNKKAETIEKLIKENPKKLIEYNYKDSDLTLRIIKKLDLIRLIEEKSIIANTPIEKIKSPIYILDILYIKELRKKNMVANNNLFFGKDVEPIKGAFVLEPKKGFYENVFVLDFKSLYPSLIVTFNLDTLTHIENENGQKKEQIINLPNGEKFLKEEGILPKLIKQIYKEREKAKKENNKIKSYALKTVMNSFYGATASPKSRFYNKKVASSITFMGRFLIKKIKNFIMKLNKDYEVIYGDTDSIFIKIKTDKKLNLKEINKLGKKLEKEINEYVKNWLNKDFQITDGMIKIEFEEHFSKFFISSKKRYVGLESKTNTLKFVGLENIRGDWTKFARDFQKKFIQKLFLENYNNNKLKEFVKKEIIKIKKGYYDKELIYTKKITKDLDKYTKITPPHVKAAREVKNFNSNIVSYVITLDGPKHISLLKKTDKLDYEHYINKQLFGVIDEFLEILNINFKEILDELKFKKNLNSFFN